MSHTTHTPPVDVLASEAAWLLRLDIPGVRQQDLSVSVERDVLTVSAVGTEDAPPRWFRQLNLPRDVDPDGIAATLRDGVLSLEIPRAGRGLRQIEIG